MLKRVTIEDLARMVKKGFDGVDKRFDEMDRRFDKIENILITDHQRRIEKLETRVEELRDLLAVK